MLEKHVWSLVALFGLFSTMVQPLPVQDHFRNTPIDVPELVNQDAYEQLPDEMDATKYWERLADLYWTMMSQYNGFPVPRPSNLKGDQNEPISGLRFKRHNTDPESDWIDITDEFDFFNAEDDDFMTVGDSASPEHEDFPSDANLISEETWDHPNSTDNESHEREEKGPSRTGWVRNFLRDAKTKMNPHLANTSVESFP